MTSDYIDPAIGWPLVVILSVLYLVLTVRDRKRAGK